MGSTTFRPRIKRGAFRTVAQRHKDQLAFLMTQLRETQPHFIRCIVPNLTKSPGTIDTPLVLDQLRCNGVLEGIRIARLGYPNRLPFAEFRRRFELLTPGIIPKAFMDGGKACGKILAALELDDRSYKLGLSKVFFKAGILAELEERRDEYLGDIFTRIQAGVRMFIARRLANKVLNRAAAVRTIQRNARIYIQLRAWPWWPLFQRVRPLLAAARNDDELRRREAELQASKELADRELKERLRLEALQITLQAQQTKMEQLLASEQSRSSEAEGLLSRSKSETAALEEELAAVRAEGVAVDASLERALTAKTAADSHILALTASLASSAKLLDTLRVEQAAWKKKELELAQSTSVKTQEWKAVLSERDAGAVKAANLERRVKELVEDGAREKHRLSTALSGSEKKVALQTSELAELRLKLSKVESDSRIIREQVAGLVRDKQVGQALAETKESELKRLTAGRYPHHILKKPHCSH